MHELRGYSCRTGGFPIGRWAFLSRWPCWRPGKAMGGQLPGKPRLRGLLFAVLRCRHDHSPRRGGAVVRSALLPPLAGVDARRPAPLALPADHGLAHGAAGAAFLRRGPGRLVGDPSHLHPCDGRDFLPHHPAAAALADQHAGGPGRAGAVVDRRGHWPIVADAPAARWPAD